MGGAYSSHLRDEKCIRKCWSKISQGKRLL